MAAYEGQQSAFGELTAYVDLSTKQYHFVKLQSATQVTICAAITDVPIGVLQNAPTAGQAAMVTTHGVSKMSADGTIGAASAGETFTAFVNITNGRAA